MENPWKRDDDDKKKKKKKKKKDKKRERVDSDVELSTAKSSESADNRRTKRKKKREKKSSSIDFPHRYILAPMVGASELAFRLLCRQYGTELAYTPMMSAAKFAHDETYRATEFQTCAADRPLVCHFCANTPDDFAQAAKVAAPYCDAIDLNLGCPQRTAYVGHFGSYLLDDKDRDLVCSIVKAGVRAVNIPIFCKIRLLDTLEQTIELCQQLEQAGASLIAVHARYRASWERKGPGARDGPALLDQVGEIKKHVTIPVITNGNTITYEDVEQNLQLTSADGLMSAEGILDNPALYLPRLGSRLDKKARVPLIVHKGSAEKNNDEEYTKKKKERKLNKKLREITKLEEKRSDKESLTDEEKKKWSQKSSIAEELATFQSESAQSTIVSDARINDIALSDLYNTADNKLKLALEYLDLATKYPVKIRSIVFHVRRMLKDLLAQYQLLEPCVAADNIDQVRSIVRKMEGYQNKPESFIFDKEKEKAQKEAMERKKREEGKRKAYEARMIRKAKREGREDLQYYLYQGAQVPTKELLEKLQQMSREKSLPIWKENHSQHCLAFHLDPEGCSRGRGCAFLHVDVLTSNTFNEQDEVAG